MSEKTLVDLRLDIDQIDDDILQLLSRRGAVCQQVMQLKNTYKKHIVDIQREHKVLHRMTESNEGVLSHLAIEAIYKVIIQQCRQLQMSQVIDKGIVVAVQGAQGSHSERAAKKYVHRHALTQVNFEYVMNSYSVVEHVKRGAATLGIMALHNSWGGLVDETMLALKGDHFQIVDTLQLAVKHQLMVLPDVPPESISRIVSHPQALAQCRLYLSTHWPECILEEAEDTAIAAAHLREGHYDKQTAVISAASCAELFDLSIVAENIQDTNCNDTTFIVTKKLDQ